MGVLLIILNQITHLGEGMVVRRYGRKYGAGGLMFNAILCLFSAVFFVVTDKGGLVFTKELVLYGIIGCILFAAGFYGAYLALQTGSFGMTRLINSFSGLISIFYGIILLHEPASPLKWIAIALIFISSFIMKYQKGGGKEFSWKWLMFAVITAVSNGFISVVQRIQQLKFNHAYNNEFMIICLVGAAVILAILGIIKEKDKFLPTLKKGSIYGVFAGMLNGASNFLNLLIISVFQLSGATPIRSGVGLATGFIVSIFIYKEEFKKIQLVGVLIAIVALVLFKYA